MRNRAGITGRSPTGTNEVIYSKVTEAEMPGECGSGPVRINHRKNTYRLPETPWKNSGTTEPAASPDVPRFPHPRILEGIIRENAEPGRNYRTITDGNE